MHSRGDRPDSPTSSSASAVAEPNRDNDLQARLDDRAQSQSMSAVLSAMRAQLAEQKATIELLKQANLSLVASQSEQAEYAKETRRLTHENAERSRTMKQGLNRSIRRLRKKTRHNRSRIRANTEAIEAIKTSFEEHQALLKPIVNSLKLQAQLAGQHQLQDFHAGATMALRAITTRAIEVKMGISEVPDDYERGKNYAKLLTDVATSLADKFLDAIPVAGPLIAGVLQAGWLIFEDISGKLKVPAFAAIADLVGDGPGQDSFLESLAFEWTMMFAEIIRMTNDHRSTDLIITHLTRELMALAKTRYCYPLLARTTTAAENQQAVRIGDIIAGMLLRPDTHAGLSPQAKNHRYSRLQRSGTMVLSEKRKRRLLLSRPRKKERFKPRLDLGAFARRRNLDSFPELPHGNPQAVAYYIDRHQQSMDLYTRRYSNTRLGLADNQNCMPHVAKELLQGHTGELTQATVDDCTGGSYTTPFYASTSGRPYPIYPFRYRGTSQYGKHKRPGDKDRIWRLFRKWLKAHAQAQQLAQAGLDTEGLKPHGSLRLSIYRLFTRSGYKVWNADQQRYIYYIRESLLHDDADVLDDCGSKPIKYGFIEVSQAMIQRLLADAVYLTQAFEDESSRFTNWIRAGDTLVQIKRRTGIVERIQAARQAPRFARLVRWTQPDPQDPSQTQDVVPGVTPFTPSPSALARRQPVVAPQAAAQAGSASQSSHSSAGQQPNSRVIAIDPERSFASQIIQAGIWHPKAPLSHQEDLAQQAQRLVELTETGFEVKFSYG